MTKTGFGVFSGRRANRWGFPLAAVLTASLPAQAQETSGGLAARQTATETQVARLTADLAKLQEDLAALQQRLDGPVAVLYQCPKDVAPPRNASWESVGCVGQVSDARECVNTWVGPVETMRMRTPFFDDVPPPSMVTGTGRQTFSCTQVGLYRKAQ